MANNPVYIIAEMAYSHDGSIALAKAIADKAAAAGADALSIHITHIPDYMVRHYGSGPGRVSAGKESESIFNYLEEISPSFEDWKQIADYSRSLGLDLLIMPNDNASLDYAKTLKPDAYVLSAACFEEYDFIDAIGQESVAVYLRVGGATLGEIETVIRLLKPASGDITLLYGHQSYPTQIEENHLNYLTVLKNTFGLAVGVADHTDAEDEFATVLPLLALPLGITCIEKHITHDRSLKGEDHESALNQDEFSLLVERVKKSVAAFGSTHAWLQTDSSANYRKTVRKRIVARCDIKAGDKLDNNNLTCKRADEGLSPALLSQLDGAYADKNLSMDSGISFDDVNWRS